MINKTNSKIKSSLLPTNAAIYANSPRAFLDEHFAVVKSHQDFWKAAVSRRAVSESSSAPRGEFAALGNHGKIQASQENQDVTAGNFREYAQSEGVLNTVDYETGEIKNFDVSTKKLKEIKDRDAVRGDRFRLQTQAAKLLPKSSTAKCLRLRQKGTDKIKVLKSIEHGTCSFKGLQTCGSVWACPVCAAKVSARRGAELLCAMRQHAENGGALVMVTFTVPHQREDDLKEMLLDLRAAQASIKEQRAYKNAVRRVGRIGTVKALEVTHGLANGWHPHIHELWFMRSLQDLELLKEDLYKLWSDAAVKADFDKPSWEHGVDVTAVNDLEKAAEYLCKEMTMAHSKQGRGGNRTPYDLLRLSFDDSYAASLFVEYAERFAGEHQLQWSRGLKKLFEVVEMTDEELAAVQEDTCNEVGELTFEQWRLICRVERFYPALAPRSTVLGLAALLWPDVLIFIDSLVAMSSLDRRKNRQSKRR